MAVPPPRSRLAYISTVCGFKMMLRSVRKDISAWQCVDISVTSVGAKTAPPVGEVLSSAQAREGKKLILLCSNT